MSDLESKLQEIIELEKEIINIVQNRELSVDEILKNLVEPIGGSIDIERSIMTDIIRVSHVEIPDFEKRKMLRRIRLKNTMAAYIFKTFGLNQDEYYEDIAEELSIKHFKIQYPGKFFKCVLINNRKIKIKKRGKSINFYPWC